jgi:hypothetical protein
MPTRLGMAQVWLTFMLLAMVVGVIVSDGIERRNLALVGVLNAIALFASTKQKRR